MHCLIHSLFEPKANAHEIAVVPAVLHWVKVPAATMGGKIKTDFFKPLPAKQQEITEDPTGLGIIPAKPFDACKLTKVYSPYFGRRATAHQPMEDLLSDNPDLQIQLLFTGTNNETYLYKNKFLNLNQKNHEKIEIKSIGARRR